MLGLPVNTRGSLIVLADDAAPGRFAAAAARPRLARTPDGRPLLRLDRWVLPPGTSGPTPAIGGRLNLTVELAPAPAEIAAANLGQGAVQPISWLDASIELNGPLFGPVEAEVAVAAGAVGAIAADLPAESAAVLASLLTRDVVSPLQITWTGSVLVRLPAVEIIASASVNRTTTLTVYGGLARRQVARSLIEANARVEIRGGNNPELEAAFRDWALNELARCLDEGRELSVRASAAQVVHWPIRLATTLDELLGDDQRRELVQVQALDPAELGAPPPVEVRVLGPFGSVLERVDVRLTPAGGTAKELSITTDAPQRAALGTGDFDWSYRAKLALQPPGEWSAPRRAENSYSLLIPIAATKDLRMEALASGLDFDHRWSVVRIELAHQGTPQDAASAVLELDSFHPSAIWRQILIGPRGKVRAKLTFVSRQGQSIVIEVGEVPGEQLVVDDPLHSHQRRLALIPAGNGWENIALAMVDLRYRDGDFHNEETIELKSFYDFVEWATPARADGPRAIEWRCHASFRDGRFEQSDWQSTESAVLAVPLQAPATRQVQLVPVFFDSARTTRIDVHFRNGDRSITQAIASKVAISITLPQGPFSWSITWSMADGSTKQTPERVSDQDVIVLPRTPA